MKKNIAVLFGGISSEHDISCLSAKFILNNIPKDKYNIYPIFINKSGEWFLLRGDTDKLPVLISPNAANADIFALDSNALIPLNIDAIFPVLHGKNGEDGSIQGIFQINNIPLVGCKLAASALCMDKVSSNIMFDYANIKQADYSWAWTYEIKKNISAVMDRVESELKSYPLFVKPSAAGSSIGVAKVFNRSELSNALQIASQEDKKVLIEKAISGHELECAILGSQDDIRASSVGEVITPSAFYDYNAKYNDDNSKCCIPANIPDHIATEIKNIAIKAYKLIGCSGLARVDFFLDNNNDIYLNEINTLPGFTSTSMYPKLFAHEGISASQLIDTLISLAFLER